jgi:hypothetical protein
MDSYYLNRYSSLNNIATSLAKITNLKSGDDDYSELVHGITYCSTDDLRIELMQCNTAKYSIIDGNPENGYGFAAWLHHHIKPIRKNIHIMGHRSAAHAIRNLHANVLGRHYNGGMKMDDYLKTSLGVLVNKSEIKKYHNKKGYYSLYHHLFNTAKSFDKNGNEIPRANPYLKNFDKFLYVYSHSYYNDPDYIKSIDQRSQFRFPRELSLDPAFASGYIKSYLYSKFDTWNGPNYRWETFVITKESCTLREWSDTNCMLEKITPTVAISANKLCLVDSSVIDGVSESVAEICDYDNVTKSMTFVVSADDITVFGWVRTVDLMVLPKRMWRSN